jgi:hypothetical protein
MVSIAASRLRSPGAIVQANPNDAKAVVKGCIERRWGRADGLSLNLPKSARKKRSGNLCWGNLVALARKGTRRDFGSGDRF